MLAAAVLVAAGCSEPESSVGVTPSAPAASIALATDVPIDGTVGAALAEPLAVEVTDADGNPVAGARVDFSVDGGGGIAPAFVTTNADGVAAATWTLGTAVGVNSATATVDGLPDSPLTVEVIGVAGPAERLVPVTSGTLAAPAGQALSTPVTVRATDAYGNPAADATIEFRVTAGGGSIAPATATTDETGEAHATWTLGPATGVQRATAGVPHVAAATVPFAATATAPTPPPATITSFFADGFESEAAAWERDGLWNRSSLADIVNTALPDYVRLAADDESAGRLPAPRSGSYAFWYGDPETGNYLGAQATPDAPRSGGTSVQGSSGLLQSPPITIPADASHAILRFESWFEVEGASLFADNPYLDADVMRVDVVDAQSGDILAWRALSPDDIPSPNGVDADAPYTSAGFDRAPVWRTVDVNVSAARGRTVWLVFYFSTVGESRNGFRGWVIDDVRVTDEPIAPAAAGTTVSAPELSAGVAPRPPLARGRP
jgi:hypothetical protein